MKGRRSRYRPVESVLCDSSSPREIAAAFRSQLGLGEIYIADLDAIRTKSREDHRYIIKSLVSRDNFDIILDAGVTDAAGVSFWLELGVAKVVIGSETLESLESLEEITRASDMNRILFSLDCRNGKTLSKCTELKAMSPVTALDRIQSSGFREIILLDLARVGSGNGIDETLVAEACTEYPAVHFLAGGGVTGIEELKKLKSIGVDGALVATVLHQGIVRAEHLPELNS